MPRLAPDAPERPSPPSAEYPIPPSLEPAARVRSAATDLPATHNEDPSAATLGLLTCFSSTGWITLTLPCLGDQPPQPRLQGRTTACIGQTTTRQLIGLRRIALGQAHFSQTVKHLRLTRSDPLRSLQTG